jgi:hypothetical protein
MGSSNIPFNINSSLRLSGTLDSLPYAHVRATPTNIAGHRGIDIRIIRGRIVSEERRSRHDLSGLTIPTLDDFEIDPGFLYLRACARLAYALNCCDFLSADRTHRQLTGPYRDAFKMNRAGPAQGDTTAKFSARHVKDIPQNPQQRHIARHVDLMACAVDE